MSWNLKFEGDRSMVYLMHEEASGEKKFVARFKYVRPKSNAKHFAKFLAKNFSPAEYFAAREGNGPESSPLAILRSKGYKSFADTIRDHAKERIMRDLGLMRVKGANGGTYYE